jgi:hypothetical protein
MSIWSSHIADGDYCYFKTKSGKSGYVKGQSYGEQVFVHTRDGVRLVSLADLSPISRSEALGLW